MPSARNKVELVPLTSEVSMGCLLFFKGAPVAQWVKRWPTDIADRVRSSLEMKSSQPLTEFHCTQPFIIIQTSS